MGADEDRARRATAADGGFVRRAAAADGGFVGRAAELALLDEALAEVGAVGDGARCVVVEGAPGIGKTALLTRFLAGVGAGDGAAARERASRAGDGAADAGVGGAGARRTALATADASEQLVAYALADQLLRALGVEQPDVLAPAGGPPGFAAVGLRLLEAFAGGDDDSAPTVVVVDDAQWADEASLRALLFATRRVVEERLLVVLAVRAGQGERLPEGFGKLTRTRTLRLDGLTDSDVAALAHARGDALSVRGAGRLRAHTRGNPLYVGALLDEVAPSAWDAGELPPAPEAFARRAQRRLDSASPPARALVEAAAVLGVRVELRAAVAVAGGAGGDAAADAMRGRAARDDADTAARGADRGEADADAIGDGLAALEEAIGLGLLGASAAPAIVFDHPLTRAAVYHDLGPARRAALHAAAATLADPTAALRHRAAAATAPAPELVATLEEFAAAERRRLAWESSADAFDAAARLSDGAERERLELEAIDSLLSAGRLAAARARLAERGEPQADPLLLIARAHLALLESRLDDAERLLTLTWEDPRAPATVRHRSAERHAAVALGRLRPDDAIAWARRSSELAPLVGIGEQTALWPAVAGLAMKGEQREALALLDGMVAADAERGDGDVGLRAIRGGLRLGDDDVAGALEDLRAVAARRGGLGSELLEAMVQVLLARAEFAAGAWSQAALHADRALSLVAAGGLERMRGEAHAAALELALARGRIADAERHVEALAEGGGNAAAALTLAAARARVAAERGDAAAVLAAASVSVETTGGAFLLGGDRLLPLLRIDALVRLDRVAEAEALLRSHEARVRAKGPRSLAARLAGARGRLEAARGERAEAERAFAAAVALAEPLAMPYELALARLALGQFLRRGGQRRSAVALLEQAREQLAALGAVPALERCERELAASGLEPAKRAQMDRSALTGRERGVAELAARGLTNRAIAAELMVSAKTIEVHLSRVFAKLGVTARGELAARLDVQ